MKLNNYQITFDEKYEDDLRMIYFTAPTGLLKEFGFSYPGAVSAALSIELPEKSTDYEDALIEISPTIVDEHGATDYDWNEVTISRKQFDELLVLAGVKEADFELTEQGRKTCETYLVELNAKRKEILDAGKDTAEETNLPNTAEELFEDALSFGIDSDGIISNGWGVTDNYDADYPITLEFGEDFVIKEE